jgi:hypothetical protein
MQPSPDATLSNRMTPVLILALGLVALILAFTTRMWTWTALPVGILFGFFLQKGDLCAAAAFSEVLMNKDWRKLGGFWVAISVSMALFAIAHRLGWVPYNPKPLLWASALVGGLVFGAGTVLAGGCISGCLVKAGAGHVNALVALATIPLGIALVETGPLRPWADHLKTHKIAAVGGGPVTLTSLTGLPYLAWSLVLLALTLAVAFRIRSAQTPRSQHRSLGVWLRQPWKAWQAGLAVGILALFAFLSTVGSGRTYPMGITHGILNLYQLATEKQVAHDFGPSSKPAVAPSLASTSVPGATPAAPAPQPRKVSWWLMLAVLGVVMGAHTAAALSGQSGFRMRDARSAAFALLGGCLVGAGAAFAMGCMVGNILSGWALLSVGMFLFGLATLLGNWLVTHFYLMGGTFSELPFTFGRVFRRR